jgi:hypothetical protein
MKLREEKLVSLMGSKNIDKKFSPFHPKLDRVPIPYEICTGKMRGGDGDGNIK